MGRYVESCMFYGYLFDKDDGEEVFDKIDTDVACHSRALKVDFAGTDEYGMIFIAIKSSIQECDNWAIEMEEVDMMDIPSSWNDLLKKECELRGVEVDPEDKPRWFLVNSHI